MSEDVKIAFQQEVLLLALHEILPSRILSAGLRETIKYKRIVTSVAEIGLIEPLSVARQKGGAYLLLDGHVRLDALRVQGATHAHCIVATDDEAFTYNKRINRPAPIQEHYMIVRALDRGASEEKIARALDLDVKAIRQRRHLLSGISSDVAELLKDKPAGHHTFQKLRKMKPVRQFEAASLMAAANNYSASYAMALLARSKPAELHRPDEVRKNAGLSTEQMAKLEREMASVSEDYKELETSYGEDMLVLVIAARFLERLLSKPEIERFLADRHPEFLENFRAVIVSSSLDQPVASAA